MKNQYEVFEKLKTLKDDEYKSFNKKLIPTKLKVLGVRLPILRKIAKEMIKQGADEFLGVNMPVHEVIMLEGLILSKQKTPFSQRLPLYEKFLQKVDNWALIDSTVMEFKPHEENDVLNAVKKWLNSKEEFVVRAGLVMLLEKFVKQEYLGEIFKYSQKVAHEGYYVKMANAWLISVCMAKYPTQTKEFFASNSLDIWTHNKAIQKSKESFRVTQEDKEFLKNFKK